MWHGKSLQTSCLFLPEDCPLVDHIIKSYKKHYIGDSSLLSNIVQPKPRVIPQTITAKTASPSTHDMLRKFDARPNSVANINPPAQMIARSSTAKEQESRKKSPSLVPPSSVSCSSNALTQGNEDAKSEIPASLKPKVIAKKVQRHSIRSSEKSLVGNSSIGANTH